MDLPVRFVVIGAYVTDCFVRTPRLPVWGSEYEVRSVRTSPGGKALNQAVALARLGAEITAVGIVGDDGCGNEILAALARDGIDISYIERRANVSTAVCAVLVTFEMPPESIRSAIHTASDRGTRIVVQPAPALYDGDAARALPWDRVDVVVCNEAEARALMNGDLAAGRLAEVLACQLGVPTVAVTLGGSGCVVCADGRSRHFSAPDVVPDTTGAGDAFVATFAAQLSAGTAADDAVHAAQSAAAAAIQRPGGHESMPSH